MKLRVFFGEVFVDESKTRVELLEGFCTGLQLSFETSIGESRPKSLKQTVFEIREHKSYRKI